MTKPKSEGDARTKNSTTTLSNYLSALAVDVAGQIAVYKRSSTVAHRAYLTAGAKLLEAREAARHGRWAAFLEACGIEMRTANNMMTLARAGLSAADVTAAGGVRGALESLREAKAVLGLEERSSAASHAEARRQARKHLRDCVVRQRGHCAICERLLAGRPSRGARRPQAGPCGWRRIRPWQHASRARGLQSREGHSISLSRG